MPDKATLFRWLREHADFRDQYARAKEDQAEVLGEEILDIADDGRNDWMDREFGKGNVVRVVDPEAVQRSKLRVEARKWLMSKMKPKVYGDSTTIKGDKDNPLEVAASYIVVPKKDVSTAVVPGAVATQPAPS